jgi:drug/metabolite transporter (DMT)-like permease
MTLAYFLLLMLSETCAVAGQIFFKKAMGGEEGAPEHKWRRPAGIAAGVVAMTIGFFLWLGLLKHFELSYLYPFEGFDRIILVLAASAFLKERMTPGLWAGVSLIVAGSILVSLS